MSKDNKKCIFCKRTIVGDAKIPVCPSCREKGLAAGFSIVLGAFGIKKFIGKK